MSDSHFPHRFIAVEGNIGAGKTTLCKKMSADFDCHLILEQFTDNPFLPPFYDNPDRYAFPVELFFMAERHKQLQGDLTQTKLFHKTTVSDYYFMKTLLFARSNLNEQEFQLFQQLFNVLNATFPNPDLLVYLHRPVPHLIDNIQKRGRNMEQEISAAYLEKIQQAYFEYFHTQEQFPILIIELEDADFVAEPAYYEMIHQLLRKEYPKGMHSVDIKQQ
jgi:deoxyguanosine kinase